MSQILSQSDELSPIDPSPPLKCSRNIILFEVSCVNQKAYGDSFIVSLMTLKLISLMLLLVLLLL